MLFEIQKKKFGSSLCGLPEPVSTGKVRPNIWNVPVESIDKVRMYCLWFGGDTSEDARKSFSMCNAVGWLRSCRVYDRG